MEAMQSLSSKELDPHGRDPHAPGAKLDAGKNLAWLFMSGFSRALESVSEVTTAGALKYTRGGWAEVPDGSDRYMQAYGRHQFDLGKGHVFDDGPGGTGKRHKAQMIWNLLASLELDLRAEEEAAKQAAEAMNRQTIPTKNSEYLVPRDLLMKPQ